MERLKKIDILNWLNQFDLDIRKTKNARFMDQKVTPDVLSSVSEAIVECNPKEPFTVNDIRYCNYANEIVTSIFNKPSIEEAPNEYDKFFSQPMKTLSYAKILEEIKQGNRNFYKINNYEILEYISLSDRKALEFLTLYIEKVLNDSGIWEMFEKFLKNSTKENFYNLKDFFDKFILKNTPIKQTTEIHRIFSKILNILSFKYKAKGTIKGRLSENIINYNDLSYNRVNFRDLQKPKNIPRNQFVASIEFNQIDLYRIQKAKRYVKKIHPYSEIHPFSIYPATQFHHIFPQNEYPEIADLPENIIALTPTQHLFRAHPNNNTHLIDKSYQKLCLIYKLHSIEIDYFNQTNFYDLSNFIEVINIGYDVDLPKYISAEELKHWLIRQ
jgi:hypothetical protein